jgi:flagellar biosynthetic protein FlhB
LRIFGYGIYIEVAKYTRMIFTKYPTMEGFFTINIISGFFLEIALVLIKATAPLFVIAIVSGLIVGYAQVGVIFTVETLSFKFSRLNPLSGLKRMFSLNAFVEMVKAIVKIIIIGFIAYSFLNGEKTNIINTINMNITNTAIYTLKITIDLAIRICVALIIMGAFDFGYQWWEYEKNLRMSKEEIKQEYKQMEGNPEIKSKIKQKQRQISMRRMMQQVPKADVIITNPTHYAVAIKYDAKVSDAPVVIAKGQDFIAHRIKEVAKENNVEIVENKLLARTIFDTVDIGKAIPQDLFQAVAEILAFIYSLKGRIG